MDELKKMGIVYLDMWGEITKGDYDKFRNIVADLKRQGKYISELHLGHSEGGDVIEAMKMGELIRKLRLVTSGPSSTKIQDRKESHCASACFMLWAAGATRKAGNFTALASLSGKNGLTQKHYEQCGFSFFCPNGYCREPERTRELNIIRHIYFDGLGLGFAVIILI